MQSCRAQAPAKSQCITAKLRSSALAGSFTAYNANFTAAIGTQSTAEGGKFVQAQAINPDFVFLEPYAATNTRLTVGNTAPVYAGGSNVGLPGDTPNGCLARLPLALSARPDVLGYPAGSTPQARPSTRPPPKRSRPGGG